jgi:hypothetical protein
MHTSIDKLAPGNLDLAHPHLGRRRACVTGTSLAVALFLSACGGGGSSGNDRPPRSFNIGVTVGGQPGYFVPISPGGSIGIAIRAGQSVALDAGEPVVWNLFIGGTQVTYGTQVSYAGVTIDTLNLNSYVVSLNTYAPFVLQNAVNVTLVATSTYDSVQVVVIQLSIIN